MTFKIRFAYRYLFLFTFTFLACKGNHNYFSIEGKYVSVKESKLEYVQRFLKNRMKRIYYSMGSELELKQDSTFKLITCGNEICGTWNLRNDTLALLVLSNQFRNESLNTSMSKPKLGMICYILNKNTLTNLSTVKVNGKAYQGISIMKKI